MSFIDGVIESEGSVRLSGGEVVKARTTDPSGTGVTIALRPEMAHLYADRTQAPSDRNILDGKVSSAIFQGDSMLYVVDIGTSGSVDVHVENLPSMTRWNVGDSVVVDFHPEAAMALAQ